jgi:hypothetical protein
MTKREFTREFAGARPGTWITYYYGFLWADRQLSKDLDKLAKAAWALYTNGEAALVQRRNGSGCEYWAVKL